MRRRPSTLLSKLARLVPVLLLILALGATPVWGGMQKHDARHEKATPCCHAQSGNRDQQPSEEEDGGCCGKDCHGCICPCAKLVLISGLRLTPTTTSSAHASPVIVLSALGLSDADPIFHPPRV